MSAEIETWMTEQQFDESEKELFRKYYPLAWNKPTAHAEVPGTIITTIPHLFRHARAEEALHASEIRLADQASRTKARDQRARTSEKSVEWIEWHRLCAERKQRINIAKCAWRNAIGKANLMRAEADSLVATARAEMATAEAEPVPVAPARVG